MSLRVQAHFSSTLLQTHVSCYIEHVTVHAPARWRGPRAGMPSSAVQALLNALTKASQRSLPAQPQAGLAASPPTCPTPHHTPRPGVCRRCWTPLVRFPVVGL
jgi:hypothetical protein